MIVIDLPDPYNTGNKEESEFAGSIIAVLANQCSLCFALVPSGDQTKHANYLHGGAASTSARAQF